MTDAQFTIALQQLRDDFCPICRARKARDRCFCKRCYFALPDPMRGPLWLHRFSREALTEWAEKYQQAKDYLRQLIQPEESLFG